MKRDASVGVAAVQRPLVAHSTIIIHCARPKAKCQLIGYRWLHRAKIRHAPSKGVALAVVKAAIRLVLKGRAIGNRGKLSGRRVQLLKPWQQ